MPGTSLLSLLSLCIKRIVTSHERCQTAGPTMKITSEISFHLGPSFFTRALVLPAALGATLTSIMLTLPSPVLQPPALFVVSASSSSSALSPGLGCDPGCVGRGGRPGLSLGCWLTHCSGIGRKGREVEFPSGSCWDASGRDPGPRGLWLRWPTQFCLILLSWWSLGFKSLRDSAVTREPLWGGAIYVLLGCTCHTPFQTFKNSFRQAEMYKCVCRWFNMGNHYCPNNFPGHHCKTTKGCEFSSNSFC